jgi:PAS domain S-box-containing protein
MNFIKKKTMILDFYKIGNRKKTSPFHKKICNEIPDALLLFTIDPSNDFNIQFLNESVYELLEITNEEIINNNELVIYEKIFRDDRDLVLQSIMDFKNNKEKSEFEFRVILPKKGLIWLKASSKKELRLDGSLFFYVRISNITDMKNQELNHKILEDRFRFALEASNEGIWDWDIIANKVFYSSQSLKILGIESLDIIDTPERWSNLVHPDDLEKYYSDIHDHFNNNTPFYENTHRVLTSSGKYRWILDKGKVIEHDSNGNPKRIIGTHTDISSQKEKELELIKTIELYSNHNNRLLNFSHIVSHNLKNQTGNIKLLLDVVDLEENYEENKNTLQYLRTFSNDLNDTVAHLSEIVSIQDNINITVEPLKLNHCIKKNIDIINIYGFENKATIINNVPKDTTINFNPAYLESVLLNFSTNAIKYAHPDRFPIIEFNYFIKKNKKILTIKDNGLGIDLKKNGHLLFGLYKTFHKQEDAQGIGLYITKNQIEAMNGKVTVNSKVGEGTTFKIIFND